MAFSVAFSVAFSLLNGLLSGLLCAVAFSVALSVAFSVAFSFVFLRAFSSTFSFPWLYIKNRKLSLERKSIDRDLLKLLWVLCGLESEGLVLDWVWWEKLCNFWTGEVCDIWEKSFFFIWKCHWAFEDLITCIEGSTTGEEVETLGCSIQLSRTWLIDSRDFFFQSYVLMANHWNQQEYFLNFTGR